MRVVSVSSSSAALGVMGMKISNARIRFRFGFKRALSVVAFKQDNDKIALPIETPKNPSNSKKIEECNLQVDYSVSEAAAKLENIYNLSPTTDDLARRRKVRNPAKKVKRLSLDKRIELKRNKEQNVDGILIQRKNPKDENEKIKNLVREYRFPIASTRLDWVKTKMPPVLSSSEHDWLCKLMQPMKAIHKVQQDLLKKNGKHPTDHELAHVMNMNVTQLKTQLHVGQSARNKLIKHNLRLVLFAIKKYFKDLVDGANLEDLCQAGVQGLIRAVDRFESKRGSLSTYSVIWIRNAIMRHLKRTNIFGIPFSLEALRLKVHRAKVDLSYELRRPPTDDEIIKKVGISPEKYHDVKRASMPVYSLHARHPVTQEEYINLITDDENNDDDKRRQAALLRLALDDVLDSLKPKESLVIRQRFGLDGKGERTLGEIAGNLNISREMVRKYEMKALMKLKHPARVDYLHRHLAAN
uniref:Sigma factor n=1 Tax=Geranium phaeum TaxID=379952 RepID=A0A0G2SYA4_9ROSI|nr:sigma factor [Geranium phaeum]